MRTSEQIDHLLAEAGNLDDQILEARKDSEGGWTIVFDSLEIGVEYDDEEGRLVMTGGIGRPWPEDRAKVYQLLLSYGFLWRDTGSVRAALAGPDGEAVLVADAFDANLTPRGLASMLAAFAERVAIWRGMIASRSLGASDAEASDAALIKV
jgi:hypothetical protein